MSTTPGNTKSKSKTFQKESAFMEVMDWVGDNIEVHEWQPEGTCWVGGEPTPHDVRCDLKHRYVITITRYVDKNNNCTLCGRPVGNTVFTVCDGCWDKKEQE